MRIRIALLVFCCVVLCQGCCGSCYTTNYVNCNDTIQCDVQHLLCLDEFSMTYWRDSFDCARGARSSAATASTKTDASAATPCEGSCGESASATSPTVTP